MSDHLKDDEKNVYAEETVTVPAGYMDEGLAHEYDDHELATTHEGEFGTKRDLKPRVVSMIALAGTIGTGLFLGSGAALVKGGPVGFFLGYALMGTAVGMMMMCLGEMTCFAPNIGGIMAMGHNYVDPAYGVLMGVNYILQTGMAIPSEMSAIAVMLQYWDKNESHVAIYIAVFLVLCIGINILGVKYFGEIEFVFATIKVATLIGLIIFGLIADLGGVPPHKEYIGGRYWRNEPFNDNFMGLKPVSLSRFLGFWSVLTKAAFSYGGIEGVAVLAGEAHNPRKTMRMAVRTVFYRVVGIYFLSTLIIGLNVSQHSPDLLSAVAQGGHTAASSPFVVICLQTGTKVLPSIINAVVMTSALSSGNENTFAVARTLTALARQGAAPKIFLRTSKQGIPIAGVGVALCFGLLAFLSVSNGSNLAFTWLSNLSALSSLVAWISICICYVRFKKALRVQGIDRRNLTFRSWYQPYQAWFCIVLFTVVLVFNGFAVFIHTDDGGFNVSDFFASYVTLPFIGLCFILWKLIKKTKFQRYEDIDLSAGPEAALRGTKYDKRVRSEYAVQEL
ncbi:hypothetical protein IAU60_003788 [Kwoniella sp. DSM 27419]